MSVERILVRHHSVEVGGISALPAGGRGREKRRLIGSRGREEEEGKAGSRRLGGGREESVHRKEEEEEIEKRRMLSYSSCHGL